MNPVLRNIIAVVVGLIAGSIVNMGLVNLGPSIIALPPGADVSTTEGLRESMKLFAPANFVFPFLAHALGTFTSAFIATKLAVSHKMKIVVGIGVFSLIGGITAVRMFGGPLWFKALDLGLAYIPTALLGGTPAGARK